jgi:hypothetical protein
MRYTHDVDALIRRNSSILGMLLWAANHGCGACRVWTAKFFFLGQPCRHLFCFKLSFIPETLGQMSGAGKQGLNDRSTPHMFG